MLTKRPYLRCPHCGKNAAPVITAGELKSRRENAGLTLRRLTALTGVSAGYWNHIENGKRGMPLWADAVLQDALEMVATELEAKAAAIRGRKSTAQSCTGAGK
jgi:transcriptional regulator with XRE-family HTH domain